MGKFRQFFTELSVLHIPYFRFRTITSKYQWIFTKLCMCIDIVDIWFEIAMGKLRQLLTELSAHHTIMAGYYRFMFLFYIIEQHRKPNHVFFVFFFSRLKTFEKML